jgi:polyisoprenoid-binding protein YceI
MSSLEAAVSRVGDVLSCARMTGAAMRAITKRWTGRVQAMIAIACLAGSGEAQAEETTYRIDPEHTFTSFEYMHWGLSLQRSRFNRQSGTVKLDMEAGSGSIDLTIDTASVSTGSEEFDKTLASDGFFDAKTYPTMHFQSKTMEFDGERLVRSTGDLTIKDVTKPVTLEVSHFACRFMVLYLKQACGANGSAKILRSDFGLGRYAPFVADEATLYFSIEAIKE